MLAVLGMGQRHLALESGRGGNSEARQTETELSWLPPSPCLLPNCRHARDKRIFLDWNWYGPRMFCNAYCRFISLNQVSERFLFLNGGFRHQRLGSKLLSRQKWDHGAQGCRMNGWRMKRWISAQQWNQLVEYNSMLARLWRHTRHLQRQQYKQGSSRQCQSFLPVPLMEI